MVLLGDVAQLEARFDPFRDSANLDARLVHPMEFLGDVDHVESRFSPFRDGVSVGAR
jgi:hypothetical protein